MTPYFSDPHLTVYLGDCREAMRAMGPESVHCVVTSPPYWGLRDYGTPGQLGLEPTPEAYVEALVGVFREVRRVLRADGTVWLNLGDSYAAQRSGTVMPAETLAGGVAGQGDEAAHRGRGLGTLGGRQDNSSPQFRTGPVAHRNAAAFGLKHKDLVGIPWRVAFALQADGWYLRSDIIWSKPNPMPESVTDRPTKSHEYVFLLSRSERYYYDYEAVREPHTSIEKWGVSGTGTWRDNLVPRTSDSKLKEPSKTMARGNLVSRDPDYVGHELGRNLRSVWMIATQPYPGAHFATFPEALVEPCVKAGTPERGVCSECGSPMVPVIERTRGRDWNAAKRGRDRLVYGNGTGADMDMDRIANPPRKVGWRRSCSHNSEPVPATVLDPFAGSGTTGLVANRLGRRAVLIDLSADYLGQVMERNAQAPLGLGA